MPRPRGAEAPQRPSPRAHLRVTGSDSDPSHHHRPITDRSPKLGDRRSPRGSQSEPVTQKKLGTRISDLESQLGQAQNELKSLKDQLASAEAAKKEAQEKLEKKTKKPPPPPPPTVKPRKPSSRDAKPEDENDDKDALEETDVFEVPIRKPEPEPAPEPERESEEMKSLARESGLKDEEIERLRSKLSEKEKESDSLGRDNEALKCQLAEARALGAEAGTELGRARDELEESKAESGRLSDQLKFVEEAREGLEAEMKKIRVQTEQWRKAADAAAAVLSGGIDGSGRIPGRCGSMDKHYITGGVGVRGFVGSPAADDVDDDGGKRKGSGIKMFGDLWRKKGQK